MRRRGRGPISGTARLSALLRGHALGFLPTRPGPRFLESPDANGRTLSGTSAASTSQSGTCRTGRCPSRLQAKSDGLRPQEPHPLRQSASPVDVPYDERDGRPYSNPHPRCQRLFDLCRQIAGLRGAIFAARKPERVSLQSKDSQKRSCACQSRLSMLCESFRGCTAACEVHSAWDEWSEAIPIIGPRGRLMGFARAQPILRANQNLQALRRHGPIPRSKCRLIQFPLPV